ncbi:hypothetical protein BJ165DRAFT_1514709 [Panaeolus papilionaceus]|nr:hypothetical protein BJ165DRAFT_1514709 [Panaeolus papilionaceus]
MWYPLPLHQGLQLASPFRATHVRLSFLPPISGHLFRLLNLITNAKRPHARPQCARCASDPPSTLTPKSDDDPTATSQQRQFLSNKKYLEHGKK